jgi:hypothetical protein
MGRAGDKGLGWQTRGRRSRNTHPEREEPPSEPEYIQGIRNVLFLFITFFIGVLGFSIFFYVNLMCSSVFALSEADKDGFQFYSPALLGALSSADSISAPQSFAPCCQ